MNQNIPENPFHVEEDQQQKEQEQEEIIQEELKKKGLLFYPKQTYYVNCKSPILHNCGDYVIKNQSNSSLLENNGVSITPSYLLITKKFTDAYKLIDEFQENKNDTISIKEGNYYERLIREEIEWTYQNNINMHPRIIIPTKQPSSSLKIFEYDCLFYCKSNFESKNYYSIVSSEKKKNCEECRKEKLMVKCKTHEIYKIIENKKETAHYLDCMIKQKETMCDSCKKQKNEEKLKFTQGIIYALEIKRSFTLNGIFKLIQRCYDTQIYMNQLIQENNQIQPCIHFMLMYNNFVSDEQRDILKTLFEFFSKTDSDEQAYDKFKDIISKKIEEQKEIAFNNINEYSVVISETNESLLSKFNMDNEKATKQALEYFAENIRGNKFKFSFVYFKSSLLQMQRDYIISKKLYQQDEKLRIQDEKLWIQDEKLRIQDENSSKQNEKLLIQENEINILKEQVKKLLNQQNNIINQTNGSTNQPANQEDQGEKKEKKDDNLAKSDDNKSDYFVKTDEKKDDYQSIENDEKINNDKKQEAPKQNNLLSQNTQQSTSEQFTTQQSTIQSTIQQSSIQESSIQQSNIQQSTIQQSSIQESSIQQSTAQPCQILQDPQVLPLQKAFQEFLPTKPSNFCYYYNSNAFYQAKIEKEYIIVTNTLKTKKNKNQFTLINLENYANIETIAISDNNDMIMAYSKTHMLYWRIFENNTFGEINVFTNEDGIIVCDLNKGGIDIFSENYTTIISHNQKDPQKDIITNDPTSPIQELQLSYFEFNAFKQKSKQEKEFKSIRDQFSNKITAIQLIKGIKSLLFGDNEGNLWEYTLSLELIKREHFELKIRMIIEHSDHLIFLFDSEMKWIKISEPINWQNAQYKVQHFDHSILSIGRGKKAKIVILFDDNSFVHYAIN